MSGRLMEWIMEELRPKVSHATARVLLVLAKHANFDGSNCFPSLQTISEQAVMPKCTVIRALSELAQRKYIKVVSQASGGRARPNQYLLTLGQPTAIADANHDDLFPETVSPQYPLRGKRKGITTQPFRGEKGIILHKKGITMIPDSIKTPVPITSTLSPSGLAPPLRVVAGTSTETPSRGTRLPKGWQPSPELRAFATSLGLDPNPIEANFVDYWNARAGAGGRKVDWSATWRCWCRKEAANKRPAINGKKSRMDRWREMMGEEDQPAHNADPLFRLAGD